MSKKVLPKKKVISAGDMSGNLTSSVVHIYQIDNFYVQCNILSGSPTGTLAVQVSGDHEEDMQGVVTVAGNWITVTSSAVTAGAGSPFFFDINQSSAQYARLIYTATSGSGSLDAFIGGKEI